MFSNFKVFETKIQKKYVFENIYTGQTKHESS